MNLPCCPVVPWLLHTVSLSQYASTREFCNSRHQTSAKRNVNINRTLFVHTENNQRSEFRKKNNNERLQPLNAHNNGLSEIERHRAREWETELNEATGKGKVKRQRNAEANSKIDHGIMSRKTTRNEPNSTHKWETMDRHTHRFVAKRNQRRTTEKKLYGRVRVASTSIPNPGMDNTALCDKLCGSWTLFACHRFLN